MASGADTTGGGPLPRAFLDLRGRTEAPLRRRTGCRAAAADLAHDLLLRVWGRAAERPDEALGYLLRGARNLAAGHRRTAALPAPTPAASSEEEAAARAALPPRARQVFLMSRVEERPYAEIARALGVSVSTVEKDMMLALAACRARLGRPER